MKEFFSQYKGYLKQIWSIFWNDFKQICFSPIFLLLVAFSCVFLSYVFPRSLFQFSASYIASLSQQSIIQPRNIHYDVFIPSISYINLLLLFCIPPLCMKLISEEKKQGTFGLLMTVPISSFQIVIGKYLALITITSVFLAITLIYPLSTIFFTEIPFGPLITSYIGLFLLAITYVALGLFASALTASVVLCVIMGLLFNIALWFISEGRDFSNNPVFLSVMEYISLGQHLTNFIKGSLVLNSFTFFFSCIVLFLFLTEKVIEFERWRT